MFDPLLPETRDGLRGNPSHETRRIPEGTDNFVDESDINKHIDGLGPRESTNTSRTSTKS